MAARNCRVPSMVFASGIAPSICTMLRTPGIETVAAEYLAPLKEAGVDTLVLGCTHYPLLEKVIGAYMGPEVRLINSGAEGARAAADCLRERDALAGPGRGSCRCFVSDRQEDFSRLASTFLGWDVAQAVEQVDISQY